MVKRVWKDPVWSKLIAGAIGAAFIGVWAHVEGNFNFATVEKPAAAAWNFVNTEVRISALLLAYIALSSVALGALGTLRLLNKTALSPQSDYLTDVIMGLRWRWTVLPNGRVGNPRMFCHECDYELQTFDSQRPMRMFCKCGNCGRAAEIPAASATEVFRKVTLEAERRIRTGDWKKSLQTGRIA